MSLLLSHITAKNTLRISAGTVSAAAVLLMSSCLPLDKPTGVSVVDIPKVTAPLSRYEGLNEKRDPITRVRLGSDVLVPQPLKADMLPFDTAGPFELRGETLASALQLILDGRDISIAFESDEGFKRRITVGNLRGSLKDVVNRVCSLADLYCHYEDGNLTVKETETFVVDLPPIGNIGVAKHEGAEDAPAATVNAAYEQIASGLQAVIGEAPTVDASTRIMIYTATQRTHKYAEQYFEKLRKNTALIIFETNIWEVTLNDQNRTGINWNSLYQNEQGGDYDLGRTLIDSNGSSTTIAPISITPSYTGSGNFSTGNVLEFISERGVVKTVSQPQITVLSGSSASLSVSQQENFVSGVSRTLGVNGGGDTVSTETETVTSGLTMTVNSAWDQSTVYGGLDIVLDDLLRIQNFQPDSKTTIQLPQTTKRSLKTEIRVRPGDAILIGGLVSEKADSTKKAIKSNTELVFLLRPRVVTFVAGDVEDTPAIVDAPHEGMAMRTSPLPNISDKVRGLFNKDSNAGKTGWADKIRGLFSTAEEVPVADNSQPLQRPALSGQGSNSGGQFGKPVASPKDLLNSLDAVSVDTYKRGM